MFLVILWILEANFVGLRDILLLHGWRKSVLVWTLGRKEQKSKSAYYRREKSIRRILRLLVESGEELNYAKPRGKQECSWTSGTRDSASFLSLQSGFLWMHRFIHGFGNPPG